jgi:hypothetical protein
MPTHGILGLLIEAAGGSGTAWDALVLVSGVVSGMAAALPVVGNASVSTPLVSCRAGLREAIRGCRQQQKQSNSKKSNQLGTNSIHRYVPPTIIVR